MKGMMFQQAILIGVFIFIVLYIYKYIKDVGFDPILVTWCKKTKSKKVMDERLLAPHVHMVEWYTTMDLQGG